MIFLPRYRYIYQIQTWYQNPSFFCLISFYFFNNANPHFVGNPGFIFLVTYTYTKSKLYIKTHYFSASFPFISLLNSNPHFVCNPRFFHLILLSYKLIPKPNILSEPIIFLLHFLLFLC